MERSFDIIFSGLALLVLSPLLVPVLIILRYSGEGEVFFLQDRIGKDGKILFLGAFHEQKFIGGHIWGFDNNTAYALVSASRIDFRKFRVNNLLLWEGIRKFIELGLKTYDMYGGDKKGGVANFKASFGSNYQSINHYNISFSKTFSKMLKIYEKYYYLMGG